LSASQSCNPHLKSLSFRQSCCLYTSRLPPQQAHSPSLVPPILGGDRSLKSPRIGKFRGLNHWKQSVRNLCISSSPQREEVNLTKVRCIHPIFRKSRHIKRSSAIIWSSASYFCNPHPKSLSQSGRGTLNPAPLLPFWEKGLGDEGQLEKWDAPHIVTLKLSEMD